ncbi:hypothetical protein ACSTK5_00385, partial [Vibrio parahaemolyticus]
MNGKAELAVTLDWLQRNGYRVIAEDNRLRQVCQVGGASRVTSEGFTNMLKPVPASTLLDRYEKEHEAMI